MMDEPWGLDYWKSEDWKKVKERLDEQRNHGVGVNPSRDELFDNIRGLSPSEVRMVICGQDPYPDSRFATGHAFSIPPDIDAIGFPRCLKVIFRELSEDLAIKYPTHGDLSGWVKQGVLLWNAIPTCTTGMSRSHDWREYHALTEEVFRRIIATGRGAVFCFLGAVAKGYVDIPGKDNPNYPVVETGHPSPRGNINSNNPFTGSRLFSTVNAKLNEIGLQPIDWRLDARDQLAGSPEVDGHVHLRKSNRVLGNITGVSLGSLYDKRGVCLRK